MQSRSGSVKWCDDSCPWQRTYMLETGTETILYDSDSQSICVPFSHTLHNVTLRSSWLMLGNAAVAQDIPALIKQAA
jgi:hypothetical protein